jgi:hypothetical protein
MKKALSYVLLIAMSMLLVASLCMCIYSFYDLNCVLNELAKDTNASGIDYFGIGWGYGICLFAISMVGLIVSIISKKIQQQRILKKFSLGAMVVFVLLIVVSVFLFYR